MFDCILSVGILCTNLNLDVEVQAPGTIQFVLADTEHGELSYQLKTDYLSTPDHDYMDVACNREGFCVYYHKFCPITKTSCNYTIVFTDSFIPIRFNLNATDLNASTELLNNFFIKNPKGTSDNIPLSFLTKENKYSSPLERGGREPINKSVRERK